MTQQPPLVEKSLQNHNYTYPNITKNVQSLSSHGYFSFPGHYIAHPERG